MFPCQLQYSDSSSLLLHCQRLKFLILTPRNKKWSLRIIIIIIFFLFITRESGKPTFSPSRGQGAIFATFLMHFLGKQRRLATWLWNDQDFLPCPPCECHYYCFTLTFLFILKLLCHEEIVAALPIHYALVKCLRPLSLWCQTRQSLRLDLGDMITSPKALENDWYEKELGSNPVKKSRPRQES